MKLFHFGSMHLIIEIKSIFLSDSDIENGGFRDLLGSEKVREC